MAKFECAEPKCSFSLPDNLTVRQQLAYYSEASSYAGRDRFERFWLAGRILVQDWQSETMPDINVDIDTATNPDIARLMIWAGVKIREHIDSLKDLPKNS